MLVREMLSNVDNSREKSGEERKGGWGECERERKKREKDYR